MCEMDFVFETVLTTITLSFGIFIGICIDRLILETKEKVHSS